MANTNWPTFYSCLWIISILVLQVRLRELSGHSQERLAQSSIKCSKNVSPGSDSSSSSNVIITTLGAVIDLHIDIFLRTNMLGMYNRSRLEMMELKNVL